MYKQMTAQQWDLLAKTWNIKHQICILNMELARLEQCCGDTAKIAYRIADMGSDALECRGHALEWYTNEVDKQIDILHHQIQHLQNSFENPDLIE